MEVDRRCAPRVPYYTHAVVTMEDEQFPCRTLDLSANGVSLVSHARLQTGAPVKVALLLDSIERWIHLDGFLVRVEKLNGLFFWGISFDQRDEKVRLLNPLLYSEKDQLREVAC